MSKEIEKLVPVGQPRFVRQSSETDAAWECDHPLHKLSDTEKRELCNRIERQRDELRVALEACKEDSIELLGDRGWWRDEPRCGYAERYEETAENIRRAQALLMPNKQITHPQQGSDLCTCDTTNSK